MIPVTALQPPAQVRNAVSIHRDGKWLSESSALSREGANKRLADERIPLKQALEDQERLGFGRVSMVGLAPGIVAPRHARLGDRG